MKIQRHVRQDFQPVYIKLETLDEVAQLRQICTTAYAVQTDKDPEGPLNQDETEIAKTLMAYLIDVLNRKGILP